MAHTKHDGESAAHKMMVAMTGAGADEHDHEPPGAELKSVQVGHEPDQFGVKGILYVPLVVIITLVLTYVLVTVIFGPLTNKDGAKVDNPQVAKLNDASFNDRIARYSSTNPKPVHGQPDTVVSQPRLEQFQRQAREHDGDSEFYRSKLALPGGGPLRIRPEDLRAENFLDPTLHQKVLAEYSWIGTDKKLARIPIDDAIKMLIEKKKLPIRKEPVGVSDVSAGLAKLSNGGQGIPAAPTPKKDTK